MLGMEDDDQLERVKRSAFRRGFLDGLLGPGLLFVPPRVKRKLFDTSLEAAFVRVGQALRRAMIRQGEIIAEERAAKGRQGPTRPTNDIAA